VRTEITLRHGVPLPASLTLIGKALAQRNVETLRRLQAAISADQGKRFVHLRISRRIEFDWTSAAKDALLCASAGGFGYPLAR
jgi:hypothetical protein